jgi:hypothetical protein
VIGKKKKARIEIQKDNNWKDKNNRMQQAFDNRSRILVQ